LKAYRKFEREYVLQMSETETIHTVSAAGMATKLMQLANGVVYSAPDAEGVRKEHFFHDEKIKALRNIVEEAQGEPILVAYTFKTDVKAILAEFPHAVLLGNNKQTIDDWNAGKIRMLLVHPKSAGHGLNLQFGGSIAVWYGLTYSLELYQQLNKRLHRKGQTRTTVIHHLVCKKTIDEIILKVLSEKDATQESLLNAMRRFIADELELDFAA
jgi:SNF2 family DNA or RNA helicase